MRDSECIVFLQWCLPQLGLRWPGFRKVRRTVCKRIARRQRELRLPDAAAYRSYLAEHRDEWSRLEEFCRIPISRFWRDRRVFDWLAEEELPAHAAMADQRSETTVRCWSAGCASGEEAYSLRMAWAQRAERAWPSIELQIIATDADATMIARAKAGRYSAGALRDLPPAWRAQAFGRDGDQFFLGSAMRDGVTILQQDLRKAWPDVAFDIILCRNMAFTYFDDRVQCQILKRLADRLRPDGLLITGSHEQLPQCEGAGGPVFVPAVEGLPVYRLMLGPDPISP